MRPCQVCRRSLLSSSCWALLASATPCIGEGNQHTIGKWLGVFFNQKHHLHKDETNFGRSRVVDASKMILITVQHDVLATPWRRFCIIVPPWRWGQLLAQPCCRRQQLVQGTHSLPQELESLRRYQPCYPCSWRTSCAQAALWWLCLGTSACNNTHWQQLRQIQKHEQACSEKTLPPAIPMQGFKQIDRHHHPTWHLSYLQWNCITQNCSRRIPQEVLQPKYSITALLFYQRTDFQSNLLCKVAAKGCPMTSYRQVIEQALSLLGWRQHATSCSLPPGKTGLVPNTHFWYWCCKAWFSSFWLS